MGAMLLQTVCAQSRVQSSTRCNIATAESSNLQGLCFAGGPHKACCLLTPGGGSSGNWRGGCWHGSRRQSASCRGRPDRCWYCRSERAILPLTLSTAAHAHTRRWALRWQQGLCRHVTTNLSLMQASSVLQQACSQKERGTL